MQLTKRLAKPTKQRRMLYQAPAHVRHRFLAAHLSPELRTSHGTRSFPVRTGDTVRVVRGDHKGVEGKITRVDLTKYRIYVEGLTREKVDGTTISVPIHPSKVIVTRFNLDDKWRKELLDTKKERRRKLEEAKVAEKRPKAKPEEIPEEVRKEAVKEVKERKPAVKEKAPKKKPTKARRKLLTRKATEKSKEEAPETEGKREEKPKPTRKTKRTSQKTKKTLEGEK